ncbi:NAD(P)-dependent alcohol dehydrogenase [Rhodococcus artemisiae]|uniref:alcohol dehydrogenase n=1 Tax=Rhodococcus artemisiae TaxID=714159 RepID=A0ABU7LGS1_9NOCA|nr:NAD(P)-dependent alcohol dehydrogenase [Rhodococcus artemisiae]MEE2060756.1 NAD(P)-dependent alcohol dehydrogenase [Rhodococcus artemisiae]
MKAVRVHEYDTVPTLDDVPVPAVRDPHDVVVKVRGAGVCRTDLHIIEGQWKGKSGVRLPYTIGHENAGTVTEIGSAVTNVKVGDSVILHPLATCGLCLSCRNGDDVHCTHSDFPGIDADGGMAEYLRTSARSVVTLDPGLEPADVAALADAGLTAYHAARKAAEILRPGHTVAVIGAGGLGHIGVQVLESLTAARIVVVDQSPEALELAKQIGADVTVIADGNEAREVLGLTGGNGAEVVLDFVGEGTAIAAGVAMLRRAGSYFVIGYGGNLDVPTIDIISSEINFIGNLVGTYNDLVELMALAAEGKVRLHTVKYRFSNFRQALDDLHHGRVRGRAVLVPDDEFDGQRGTLDSAPRA